MCGHTRNNKIKNENVKGKLEVVVIENKMRENRLIWFGHVNRKPTNAPIRKYDYKIEI